MRILFAGTPEFALPSLKAVLELCSGKEYELTAVLTAPARPSGRGRQPRQSPVAQAAAEADVPIICPARLGSDARSQIEKFKPDLLVCVAYGRIFGPKMLALFPYGGINLHPSLLPAHRGPAPVPAAILNGDSETGLTVQKLALEMDAGDILIQERRILNESETSAVLSQWASERGAELLCKAIVQIAEGQVHSIPQNHDKASYCSLLNKEDGRIDWNRSAIEIDRQIRAYNPYPGAFTYMDSQKLTIWNSSGVYNDESESFRPGTVLKMDRDKGILIQTGSGLVGVIDLQLAHRKSLDHRTFCNGSGDLGGKVLGEIV
ncbi:methionyl-tRNA formyltransferase [Spirochaeta dissipatitropha]